MAENQQIGWVEGGEKICLNEGVKISGQALAYLQRQLQPQEHTQPMMTHEQPKPVTAESEFSSHQPPPAPPQDPRLGDKTPAYRAWFRQYHTQEEYQKKYAGRKVSDEPGALYGGGDIPESQVWKDNPEVWFKSMK
jgi:hypothetical protein